MSATIKPIRDGHTLTLHIDKWADLHARLHCPYQHINLEETVPDFVSYCRQDENGKHLKECNLKVWWNNADFRDLINTKEDFDVTTIPVHIEWWIDNNDDEGCPILRPYREET